MNFPLNRAASSDYTRSVEVTQADLRVGRARDTVDPIASRSSSAVEEPSADDEDGSQRLGNDNAPTEAGAWHRELELRAYAVRRLRR